MLFPYKYTAHPLDRLHAYIEHTVLNVWCKASTGKKFTISMLHKSFRPIVQEVSKNDRDYLLKPIKAIYSIFSKLTPAQRKLIADGFQRNNDIKGLCAGIVMPLRYEDIKTFSPTLTKALSPFFKNLYTKILGIKAVKDGCGDLMERYKEFMKVNKKGKCPFCGLEDIKSEKLSVRDAYDHYLPKDIYPFNSVNFKNLVPACHTCNSSYKLTKDPIRSKKPVNARKAFYPFMSSVPGYSINVIVKKIFLKTPKNNNIDVSFSSKKALQEVNSWTDVYGIIERYEDKCCSDDAKDWIEQLMDERKDRNFSIKKYMAAKKKELKHKAHVHYRFLQVPFLEGYLKYSGFTSISNLKS